MGCTISHFETCVPGRSKDLRVNCSNKGEASWIVDTDFSRDSQEVFELDENKAGYNENEKTATNSKAQNQQDIEANDNEPKTVTKPEHGKKTQHTGAKVWPLLVNNGEVAQTQGEVGGKLLVDDIYDSEPRKNTFLNKISKGEYFSIKDVEVNGTNTPKVSERSRMYSTESWGHESMEHDGSARWFWEIQEMKTEMSQKINQAKNKQRESKLGQRRSKSQSKVVPGKKGNAGANVVDENFSPSSPTLDGKAESLPGKKQLSVEFEKEKSKIKVDIEKTKEHKQVIKDTTQMDRSPTDISETKKISNDNYGNEPPSENSKVNGSHHFKSEVSDSSEGKPHVSPQVIVMSSCEIDTGEVRSFWELKEQQYIEVSKVQNQRMSMTKRKSDWKYMNVKPEFIPLSEAAYKERVPSVREINGMLDSDIPDIVSRACTLEWAIIGSEEHLSAMASAAKEQRDLEKPKLDPDEFKAAQKNVKRALLKSPKMDDDDANLEANESLLKALNLVFKDKSSKSLTGTTREKFVKLLQSAGVLRSGHENDQSNKKKDAELDVELSFKQINMKANPFMHSASDSVRDTFVSSICELIKKERNLEEVNFNYGALQEKHVLELSASLDSCENLKYLYLDSNTFGNKGLVALSRVLRNNKDTLITLSIHNLPVEKTLSTDALRQFVEAIEESSSLIRLGFDMKWFRHHEFMDRVSKHLQRNFDRLREARISQLE